MALNFSAFEKKQSSLNLSAFGIESNQQEQTIKYNLPETAERIKKAQLEAVQYRAEEAKIEADIPFLIRFGQELGRTTRDIGQSIARSFIATGSAIVNRNIKAEFVPRTRYEKAIVGTDKPVSFQSIGDEILTIPQEFGIMSKKEREGAGKYALPIGVFFAALDIVPIGGGKSSAIKGASELISKTSKVDEITRILRPIIKGSESNIERLAIGLKNVDDAAFIEKTIKSIDRMGNLPRRVVNFDDLKFVGDDFEVAQRRIASGILSQTDESILVRKAGSKFEVLDGNYRIAQKLQQGVKNFEVQIAPTPPAVRKILGKQIPTKITKSETTLLKERIRNIARGAREGASESRKAVRQVQEEIIKYVEKNLPVSERGRFLRAIKNINDEKKLNKALEEYILPKVKQFQEAKALSKELGTLRSKLAYIRKIGEFRQGVVNEIKKEVGLEKPIREATKEQLDTIISKIKERLSFKVKRGFEVKIEGAEKKVQEITGDMYESNKQILLAKEKPILTKIKNIPTEMKDFSRDILGVVSTTLAKIDPSLRIALRKFEARNILRKSADNKIAEPYIKKVSQMAKEDFADFDFALKNGDEKKIMEMVKKYGMEDEYRNVRIMLDDIHKRVIEVGGDMGYLKNYIPRHIKDTEGFLEYFRKQSDWSILDEAIKRREMDLGRDLSEPERAYLINTMIRGYSGGNITLAKASNMKDRVIDFITPELNQFYSDSSSALVGYIDSMNDWIEARRFFGKARNIDKKLDQFNKIDDSIGQYTLDLLTAGKISPTQEKTLREVLQARFNPLGTRGFVAAYKNLSYIDVMGSLLNAITQIGDLAFPIYNVLKGKTSLIDTVAAMGRAVIGKSKISKADLGLKQIAAEFSDKSTLGAAVDRVFRLIGLTGIDRIGKETLINPIIKSYQSKARKPTEQFIKELKSIFGKETNQVLDDLANDVISENVKVLALKEMMGFQPITLSEVPLKYINGGNGRIFYMLKTWTIKMFDVYRNEVFAQMKTDKVRGIRNLVALTASLVVMNATADEIKDLILGRKTSLKDRTVDNILKLVGFSRYSTYQAQRDGIGRAAAGQMLPPTQTLDDISRDINTYLTDADKSFEINEARSIKTIPILGDLYYWWFGKGVKTKEKEAKKTKTSQISIPKLKSSGEVKGFKVPKL